jgi:hypothetical protein
LLGLSASQRFFSWLFVVLALASAGAAFDRRRGVVAADGDDAAAALRGVAARVETVSVCA